MASEVVHRNFGDHLRGRRDRTSREDRARVAGPLGDIAVAMSVSWIELVVSAVLAVCGAVLVRR